MKSSITEKKTKQTKKEGPEKKEMVHHLTNSKHKLHYAAKCTKVLIKNLVGKRKTKGVEWGVSFPGH